MKRKAISIFCAGVLLCLITSCGNTGNPEESASSPKNSDKGTPEITAAYQNTNVPCFWGYYGNVTFRDHLSKVNIEDVPYVPLGYTVHIAFDEPPEELELVGFPLNADGSDRRFLSEDNIRQNVELNGKNATFVFKCQYGGIDENKIPRERQYPYGYRLTYRLGQKEQECYFMLRTDDSYWSSAPQPTLLLNDAAYKLSGVLLPSEIIQWRTELLPYTFSFDPIEEESGRVIRHGDTLSLTFPEDPPDSISVENDLFFFDTSKPNGSSNVYKFQETRSIPEKALTKTKDGVSLKVTSEAFTQPGEEFGNRLYITCDWAGRPSYVYSLWFRVDVK